MAPAMKHYANSLSPRYGRPRVVERPAEISDEAWEQIRRRITQALEAHPDAWEIVTRALSRPPEVPHED